MKFWQKESETSPMMQALIQQLACKDTQIAELMECQRESNILLKNDQEQLLQLREAPGPVSSTIPYATVEEQRDQVFEEVKLRAGVHRSSFLNWLLIAVILVASYVFNVWVEMVSVETLEKDEYIANLNSELSKASYRINSFIRDIDVGRREFERVSYDAALAKEELIKKEHEFTAQMIAQSQRVKELEKVNTAMMAKALKGISPPPDRRK